MKWKIDGLGSDEKEFIVSIPAGYTSQTWLPIEISGQAYTFQWHKKLNTIFVKDSKGVEQSIKVRTHSMTQFPGESQTEVIMELSQSGNHLIHRHALQVEPFVPGGGFRKKADSSGGAVVRSPMVGKILQVKVSEGETVKKGQELLTIEAMKMENKILASASGTVSKLKATPGEQTTIGAALLSIDADPS